MWHARGDCRVFGFVSPCLDPVPGWGLRSTWSRSPSGVWPPYPLVPVLALYPKEGWPGVPLSRNPSLRPTTGLNPGPHAHTSALAGSTQARSVATPHTDERPPRLPVPPPPCPRAHCRLLHPCVTLCRSPSTTSLKLMNVLALVPIPNDWPLSAAGLRGQHCDVAECLHQDNWPSGSLYDWVKT